MSQSPPKNLYCRESKWSDLVVFFLANVVAHAATVPSSPRSNTIDNIESMLLSLFLPYFGIGRAIGIIRRAAIFASSPLQQAKRAEAICAVGRTRKWRESGGPVIGPTGAAWFFSDTDLEFGKSPNSSLHIKL